MPFNFQVIPTPFLLHRLAFILLVALISQEHDFCTFVLTHTCGKVVKYKFLDLLSPIQAVSTSLSIAALDVLDRQ